jgi:hypothetical protein
VSKTVCPVTQPILFMCPVPDEATTQLCSTDCSALSTLLTNYSFEATHHNTMCYFYAGLEELYAQTKKEVATNNKEEPLAADKLTTLSEFTMHSKRSHPSSPTDALEHPCKRRCIAKKTVTFSSTAKLRTFTNDNSLQAYSSWHTDEELSSMKKRARNLSMLHYMKTRPGQANPSKRSGIAYNCHPAHYEIIEESLRGLEHHTDISNGRRRELSRYDAIRLVEENQDKTSRSKLACMYRESTKEAMLFSREIAEEDAKVAAAILAEDLKQDDVVPSISPSTSSSIPSVTSTAMSSPSGSLAPPISLDYLGYYCLALQYIKKQSDSHL